MALYFYHFAFYLVLIFFAGDDDDTVELSALAQSQQRGTGASIPHEYACLHIQTLPTFWVV